METKTTLINKVLENRTSSVKGPLTETETALKLAFPQQLGLYSFHFPYQLQLVGRPVVPVLRLTSTMDMFTQLSTWNLLGTAQYL